jgi:preprotein translocase subunit YajC
VWDRLCELASANSPVVAEYWEHTQRGRGIPDSAFKYSTPYLFPDQPPARTFRTSGTTGASRGSVGYSAHGMELMELSIVENARRHIFAGLERPAVVRLVPSTQAAPQMVMAYGMELIATEFGDPELSAVVVTDQGLDTALFTEVLQRAVDADVPVVLIGASFTFVGACEMLARQQFSCTLPVGSRVIDAGGFKGKVTTCHVEEMRAALASTLGVASGHFINLFGMTELASQLYDCADQPIGPLGERPKGREPFVEPRVLEPYYMTPSTEGYGLLEVLDLCLIDRPPAVLTGDLAIARPHGAAIIGRVRRDSNRGCSLAFEQLDKPQVVHA